jgi:hypothetical protein
MAIAFALACALCLMLALLRHRDPTGGQPASGPREHERRAMRFRATATTDLRDLRQWWPMFVPAFFPLVMLLFAGDVALWVAGTAFLVAAGLATARNSEWWWRGKAVHVGADGVFIEAKDDSRFIPYAEVTTLDKWSVLVLRSSEQLRLVADPRDAAALYMRLIQALARFRSRPAPPARARAFVTAGTAEAYRSDAITADDALDVLEDPAALEEQRVAAASWLARAPDRDAALPRLAAIAEETVSPRVRFAVDAARVAGGRATDVVRASP